jgi:metallo-beta-lactamase family protein
MKATLRFLGAARNVTGSRYLLDAAGARILVDCGIYQERALLARNWDPFPVPPASIDAVLLTHAHLDHCAYLPRLVSDGFRGAVYCTPVTAEIGRIVMLDFAHIQAEDTAFKIKRHAREGRRGAHPEAALYTAEHVAAALALMRPAAYNVPTAVSPGVTAEFLDAGHILGSAEIRLTLNGGGGGAGRTLLFSGDLGRWNRPLVKDPTLPDRADYVVVESTYGDRLHANTPAIENQLAEIIEDTRRRGGNVVIPSFAIERAQELLYYLNKLSITGRISHLHTFLDSPMAISVTELFRRHPELQDPEIGELLRAGRSPFDFAGLSLTRSVEESKAINHVRGTVVIIAGSGMCTGGRIKHHLANNIEQPQSTILFIGYQAVGTLGRQIAEGNAKVRILGLQRAVRARVEQIHGFSAHADRDDLIRWISHLKPAPRQVFVTHGEPDSAQTFAALVRERMGWKVSVPDYDDRVELA